MSARPGSGAAIDRVSTPGRARGPSDFAWYATGDLAWKGAGFAVLAIVVRTAPQAHVDALVLSATVYTLLTVGGDLGFAAIGMRLAALGTTRATGLRLRRTVQARRAAATAGVGLPAALVAVLALSADPATGMLLAFLAACWLPYFATLDWALLALRRYPDLARARLAAAGSVVGATAIGALLSIGAWAAGAGYAIGHAAAAWIGRRAMRRARGGTPPVTRRGEVARALSWRASAVLSAAFCANSLFQTQEVLMTGRWLGTAAAAEFAAAHRIVFAAYTAVWIVTQYLSPRLATADGRGPLLRGRGPEIRRVAAVGAACCAVLALGAGPIASALYGERFPATAALVLALSGTVILESLVALLGTLLVLGGAGRAALATLAAGCAASAIAFAAAASAGVEPLWIPVIAKHAGYLALLAGQLAYLGSRGRGRQ